MATNLGIIGGGQLALKTILALQKHPDLFGDVIPFVMDPKPASCPAAKTGALIFPGESYMDAHAIARLAGHCDVVTYDLEFTNAEAIAELEAKGHKFFPNANTLRIIQDKYLQKVEMRKHGVALPEFFSVANDDDLHDKLKYFGGTAVVKKRRDGYDGKGYFVLTSEASIAEMRAKWGDVPIYIERRVDFDEEISVLACRDEHGHIATYGVAHNHHEGGVLRRTIASRDASPLDAQAQDLARKVAEGFSTVGVFGVELFVEGGKVMHNEIAPRPHNSYHFTELATQYSQFDQLLLCVLGMNVGSTDFKPHVAGAVMYNILGPAGLNGPYRMDGAPKTTSFERLHDYGKDGSKEGRKIGDLVVVSTPGSSLEETLLEAKTLFDNIKVVSR